MRFLRINETRFGIYKETTMVFKILKDVQPHS